MKLELLQENLKTGLSIVSRVIASHPQIPILTNVLLKASSGELEIVASNTETTISTKIGAKVEISGEFTVPGKMFVELIGGLSLEKISLVVNDGILEVSGGKFKAKINGTPASEFPKLANLENETKWEINVAAFQSVLGQTVFCSAMDESRAVLTGVLFRFEGANLILAATDGFRLSVNKIPFTGDKSEAKFIVPSKTLTEVCRLLTGKSFVLNYSALSNQVVFDFGDTKIYSRLISGNFPDFEKIIPSTSILKVDISTEELNRSVKIASVFARESSNILKFVIGKGKFSVMANSSQTGENENEIEVVFEKGEGEDFVIAFNYKYLSDLLNNINSSNITMEFNGPLASGVFRLPKDPNFLHIIMPVRVQN
ncbi:DNA polymerase III subunit beta [Candidatus Microgenomates bacterium]|nr:DNA polymerase III subunit beta [Candidatus Microgenomates bacterium]